jgi:redox-sensitive bicupin YhaK (pirin superfamily)
MKIINKGVAKKIYPTGNPNFSTMQAFPSGLSYELVDPMLMCDYFTFTADQNYSKGKFPIDWHPHAGMDICTYMKQGIGRHADSLGNNCEFKSPGIQWISVGSGIEHAEGGGTPKGSIEEGFQLWFNTPNKDKNKDPVYGLPDEPLPIINFTKAKATLISGKVDDVVGPFKTVQPIQVLDFELESNAQVTFTIPKDLTTSVLFVYYGSGKCMNEAVSKWDVLLLNESTSKNLVLSSKDAQDGLKAMLFSGVPLKEPITWLGPFVQGSEADMQRLVKSYQSGRFPPVRVENFKK